MKALEIFMRICVVTTLIDTPISVVTTQIRMKICVVTTLIGVSITAVGVFGLLIGAIITEILDKRG